MMNCLQINSLSSGRPAGGRVRNPILSFKSPQKSGRCKSSPVRSLQVDAPATSGHVHHSCQKLVSVESVRMLEEELLVGEGSIAIQNFNGALCSLTPENWVDCIAGSDWWVNTGGILTRFLFPESKLRPVFNEWCYNLESFNPAFTAVLLKVQQTIGKSDYYRRDSALKQLIQPLAGEYGMHNGEQQANTHRHLFCNFYSSIFQDSVRDLLKEGTRPVASELLFEQMIRDILDGGECKSDIQKASYALGYNLGIEYLAQLEKGAMLESFRELDRVIFSGAGLSVDWEFLEIHALDEVEHAAIGRDAVLSFVPEEHLPILKRAINDHDNDFAVFYNKLTAMLM